VTSEPSGPQFERRQGERRKEERERIRQFEQRIAAEQDERRRLALFLHDGAVQSLAGIALMLDAVDHAIAEGRTNDARRVLASALEQHRKTIQSLRDLSFNIEPVALRDQGFEPTVRALAERVGLDREVRVDVDVCAAEALAERAQVTFYQLIRVALDQAAGRRPSRIQIRVADTDEGDARLTVADDGRPERRQAGVEELEERARHLSGTATVERGDAGTTITVVLPGYAARS
jgi:two-component system, NarL family, sensor histidine kinase UhpB